MGRCRTGAGGASRCGGRKKGLGTEIEAEIRNEAEALLTDSGGDLEAVETALRWQALRVAALILERRLNADRSDYSGPYQDCSCGRKARYIDRRKKTFQSVLGPLLLERAYYHCSHCGEGFCPRDESLGLAHTALSPAVTRMVGAVGAAVSFAEGSELLRELAGIEIDAKQVERTAEALGAEIAADERAQSEPASAEPLPPTLYLGLDGTGIPMRASELAGHAGKQEDGKAKTREVKLCTVWSAESRDKEGKPVRDHGSVSYSAAIESAASGDTHRELSEFAQRVEREASRRRFGEAHRKVVIGDGAPWIWNIAEELFPDAIQIVDRFHVKETLTRVAKALYPDAAPQAHQWAQRRHQELDDGKWSALHKAVARQAERCEEARKCADYLRRNRHRMRYPEFHAQQLCTSSGVVEAGCKVTAATRLKRAGMHWTVRGANDIIALRCCRLSGRFEDFWERRASRRAA